MISILAIEFVSGGSAHRIRVVLCCHRGGAKTLVPSLATPALTIDAAYQDTRPTKCMWGGSPVPVPQICEGLFISGSPAVSGPAPFSLSCCRFKGPIMIEASPH